MAIRLQRKHFKLATSLAEVIVGLRDKPGMLDYLATGVRVLGVISEHFVKECNAYTYFTNENGWEHLKMPRVRGAVKTILEQHPGKSIVNLKGEDDDNTRVVVIEMENGATFGWIDFMTSSDGYFLGPYVKGSYDERARTALHDFFWKTLGTKHIQLSADGTMANGFDPVFTEHALDVSGMSMIPIVPSVVSNIEDFSAKKEPRSIIFHGPPGTGKSTIINMVAASLDRKSFRIPIYDMFSLNPETILSLVEIFRPELLIIDDLDRVANPVILLDGLERLRDETGILLVSMNSTKSCTPALLRPGRLDEEIEVRYVDESIVKSYISKDDPMFDRIKLWPIAFIREYCKRRDVLGIERAHASVDELDRRQKALLADDDEETGDAFNEKDEASDEAPPIPA